MSWRCKVCDSIPDSANLCAARDVGASPTTLVAFVFGGFADSSQRSGLAGTRYALKTDDFVLSCQDLLYGCSLAGAQVRMILLRWTAMFRDSPTDRVGFWPSSHFSHVVAFILIIFSVVNARAGDLLSTSIRSA